MGPTPSRKGLLPTSFRGGQASVGVVLRTVYPQPRAARRHWRQPRSSLTRRLTTLVSERHCGRFRLPFSATRRISTRTVSGLRQIRFLVASQVNNYSPVYMKQGAAKKHGACPRSGRCVLVRAMSQQLNGCVGWVYVRGRCAFSDFSLSLSKFIAFGACLTLYLPRAARAGAGVQ